MSKRNSEGDVIANRMSLLEAKGQKLLASLYGSRPDWDTTAEGASKTLDEDDDQDLKQNYAHDRIGLGGILPKDVEDGSFTSRIRTSDDKLLQQLIGKKKAKAHITAKQEAALRPNAAAKAKQYAKPAAKKEESDDDEEGRAATFKSKRQKKKEKQGGKTVDSDDEDEETRAKRLDGSAAKEKEGVSNEEVATEVNVDAKATGEDQDEEAEAIQPAPKKARTKPKSFLDEILAERSKKKSKKGKA